MSEQETRMGGSLEGFPETVWSTVLGAPDSPEGRRRLAQLCEAYWRPAYRYVRMSGHGVEDAKDLTQAFFAMLLGSDWIDQYRPERGRFRTYLKACLKHYMSQVRRDQGRLKRGGGRAVFSLDADALEGSHQVADPRQVPPEESFDRQWALDVLERCLPKLREGLLHEGKSLHLRIFEAYDLAPTGAPKPTYRELAERFGIPRHEVDNYLASVRSQLQQLLLGEIANSVSSTDDLLDEMRNLFWS